MAVAASGTSDPSGMSKWGDLFGLAGDALGAYSASKQNKYGNTIAEEANPFGKYRPEYGSELEKQMANPHAFEEDPAYQFARDQGLEAVQRKMNASGFAGSGNNATELMKYASGLASQYRGTEMDRLANLAGAGINPTPMTGAVNAQGQAFDQGGTVLNDIGRLFGSQEDGGSPGILNGTKGDGQKGGIGGVLHSLFNLGGGSGGVDTDAISKAQGGAIGDLIGAAGTVAGAAGIGTGAASAAGASVAGASAAGAGGLGGTIASGISSVGGAVGSAMSTAYTALASMGPVGWVGAAALAAGAAIAGGQPKSSPLNKFDVNNLGWTKGENFADSKYTADQLNSYYGPALKKFAETGDAVAALAALKAPANSVEEKLAKGAKHLFSGTGNPFRQIAKEKGYTGGIWEAGNSDKKGAINAIEQAAG